MKFLKFFLFINVIVFYSTIVCAELRVNVKKNADNTTLIAIVPFGWQESSSKIAQDISAIVNADLSRNSFFKTLPTEQMLTQPTRVADVQFKAWQVLGQDYLVIGNVEKLSDTYTVLFQLFDVNAKEQLLDYKLSTTEPGLRRAAHQISDLIYEKITHQPGIFNTKIAFVSRETLAEKLNYSLQVADIDGFNAKAIVTSTEPLLSPAWSPDGEKIAYVSFENQHSAVFIQTVATGERKQIAAFSGINGAPAWSPDGNKLALTLSKDGNPNIYLFDLQSGGLTQLTKLPGINTEPTWSPDGENIVFTSNQNGSPQLYKMLSTGGNAEPLTVEGEYNTTAHFSPDGQKIAFIHAEEGKDKIAVMELSSGVVRVLTTGDLDESPSFSSNGAMILYATQKETKSTLNAVSIDGKIRQKLDNLIGEINNPSWMPQK